MKLPLPDFHAEWVRMLQLSGIDRKTPSYQYFALLAENTYLEQLIDLMSNRDCATEEDLSELFGAISRMTEKVSGRALSSMLRCLVLSPSFKESTPLPRLLIEVMAVLYSRRDCEAIYEAAEMVKRRRRPSVQGARFSMDLDVETKKLKEKLKLKDDIARAFATLRKEIAIYALGHGIFMLGVSCLLEDLETIGSKLFRDPESGGHAVLG